MANCVLDTLRAIWVFILGSLRMVLFLSCILFFFFQLLVFYVILKEDDSELDLPQLKKLGSLDYISAVLLMAVALLGCFGSFYKHHPSIKLFAILTAISAVFLIYGFLSERRIPKDMEEKDKQFFAMMDDYFDNYQWKKFSGAISAATQKWDNLQHYACCGIKGPNDWNKHRPYNVPDDAFPSTCCFRAIGSNSDEFCYKDNRNGLFFNDGCRERVEYILMASKIIDFQFLIVELFLCVLACVVGILDLDRCSKNVRNPIILENATDGSQSPQQFQRFENSVYVRQPPVNQDYSQRPNDKSKAPSVYPDLGRDQAHHAPPPPSYGTGM